MTARRDTGRVSTVDVREAVTRVEDLLSVVVTHTGSEFAFSADGMILNVSGRREALSFVHGFGLGAGAGERKRIDLVRLTETLTDRAEAWGSNERELTLLREFAIDGARAVVAELLGAAKR